MSKNQEIIEFGDLMFKIMKSGFYQANLKRKKSIKTLNLSFLYKIVPHLPKNAIIISICFR